MKFLIWFFSFLLIAGVSYGFDYQKVFAFTCSPLCEAPSNLCAIDPDDGSTQLFSQTNSTGMCINLQTPNRTCDLSGDSWCTSNILDGWEITSSSGNTTPTNGSYFNWLTGAISSTSTSQYCIQPGDKLFDNSHVGTCSVTASPIDPMSSMPDRDFVSNTGSQSSGMFDYYLKDFSLEAVRDCSIDPSVTLYWNNPNYTNTVMDNLTIKRRTLGNNPVEDIVYTDSSYDKSYSKWTEPDILDENKTYEYLISSTFSGSNVPVSYPVPGYRSDHKYNFPICLDTYGPIKFAIADLVLWDNSGNYTITTCANGTCFNPETIGVPFVNGEDGVYTTNNYGGCFSIEVSGYGEAANTNYSDAFYIFTDEAHVLLPNITTLQDEFTLKINDRLAKYSLPHNGQTYNAYSNTVSLRVRCDLSLQYLDTGFDVTSELNGGDAILTWGSVAGATQYFVTKNNVPIYDSNSQITYTWNLDTGSTADSSTTTFFRYLPSATNTFTDTPGLINPGDTAIYRIYAYKASDYAGSSWDSRYSWDHDYELSEEVRYHQYGGIENGITNLPCSEPCALDTECDTGLSCISSQCLNIFCPAESSCVCTSLNPVDFSSLTDAMTNPIISQTSNHTLLYDIRITDTVTDGSLKIDFPSSFVFGSLGSSDITTTGGDVTWGSATINGNSIIIPFTGELSSSDDRITIDIGNTNFITNSAISGNYNVSLSSHSSNDGSGTNVDLVSDRILIMSADSEGKSSVSDTLSNSKPSYDSRHAIRYDISQSANTITNGSLKITLANEFNLAGLTDNDITILGGDVTWNNDKTINSGGTQIGFLPSLLNNIVHAQGENSIIFNFTGTLDSTDNMITIIIGDTNYINNPTNVGPFSITLTTYSTTNAGGSVIENLMAMVHINDGVTVTANVPPSLTFTVTGVNMGTNVNGAVTNVLTTSTDVNFGVFTGADNKVGAQDLTVSTNATNGFVVTIQKEGDFISGGADTINDFTGTNASPTTWASPPGSGTESYFGYTTNDYTLSQTEINRFNTNKWAKAESIPYEVMYHTDPINGITQGQGTTRIGYQMEITNLQSAGIYETKVMYVCTATF